jgi:hypothetical protein
MSGARRLVFVMERKNYYRVMGPVVDAALRRGWEVECWHDWTQPRWGTKASEFPDAVPPFQSGTPKVVAYRGEELVAQLSARPPDAVVALGPRPRPAALPRTVRWVGLQYMTSLVDPFGPQGFLGCDLVAGYSRFWLEQAIEYFKESGALREADVTTEHEIVRRFTTVGVPELDQVEAIEPQAVRERFGLPADRPVVLYLPYPTMSNPRTFWLRHVYAPGSRIRRALAVLGAFRFDYWQHVTSDWNDRSLVTSLRAFCDANDALLVVKSRLKDPVPRYTASCADLVLYDPSYYPATILELLSVASLCVHFFSSAVYESVFLGVPSLCIAPSADDMGLSPLWSRGLFNVRDGESYNVPGASYFMPLPEAFDALPRARLKDFPMDPVSRAHFVDRFLGFDDTRSSERFLDLVAAQGEQP